MICHLAGYFHATVILENNTRVEELILARHFKGGPSKDTWLPRAREEWWRRLFPSWRLESTEERDTEGGLIKTWPLRTSLHASSVLRPRAQFLHLRWVRTFRPPQPCTRRRRAYLPNLLFACMVPITGFLFSALRIMCAECLTPILLSRVWCKAPFSVRGNDPGLLWTLPWEAYVLARISQAIECFQELEVIHSYMYIYSSNYNSTE